MADPDAGRQRSLSAAAPSPFPPIADYAFLSDCHTGALVAPDGSVEWLCIPSFDAPSVFASVLDRGAGTFRFGPHAVAHPTSRSYEPGTNVMTTTWKTPTGWGLVREAMTMRPSGTGPCDVEHVRPPGDWDAGHMLLRTIECLRGEIDIEIICEPVFDYGRVPGEWRFADERRRVAEATGSGGFHPTRLGRPARHRGTPDPRTPSAPCRRRRVLRSDLGPRHGAARGFSRMHAGASIAPPSSGSAGSRALGSPIIAGRTCCNGRR